jgi:hypothetical protein
VISHADSMRASPICMKFSTHMKITNLLFCSLCYHRLPESHWFLCSQDSRVYLLKEQRQIPSFTETSFSRIGYSSLARKLLLQVLSFLTKVLTTNKKTSLSIILLYCQMVHGTSHLVNCGRCDSGLVKHPGVKKECKGFLALQFQKQHAPWQWI